MRLSYRMLGVAGLALLQSCKPEPNTFSTIGSMAHGRAEHFAVKFREDDDSALVLIVGGYQLSESGQRIPVRTAEIFNCGTLTFKAAGELPNNAWEGSAEFLSRPSATLDGPLENRQDVVVFGGLSAEGSIVRYNGATGDFTSLATLPSNTMRHRSVSLGDRTYLLTGGRTEWAAGPNLGRKAGIFDAYAGAWTALPDMASVREEHTMTRLWDGKVLIVGGQYPAPLASAEIYDPATRTFAATGNLNFGRYGHTATLLGSALEGNAKAKVLIAGGFGMRPDGTRGVLSSAELYDVATGTFALTGSMAVPRNAHTASNLRTTEVLIAGGTNGSSSGSNDPGRTYYSSSEIFDLTTGTFRSGDDMYVPRAAHSAVGIWWNTILISGGRNATGTLKSAELYRLGPAVC